MVSKVRTMLMTARHALQEMGLLQFRKYFCRYTEVQQKAVEGLLQLLELDRRASHGVVNNKMLLKSLLRMMSELRIYKDIFEPQFLEATEHFYRAESVAKLGYCHNPFRATACS
jgi:cullin-4